MVTSSVLDNSHHDHTTSVAAVSDDSEFSLTGSNSTMSTGASSLDDTGNSNDKVNLDKNKSGVSNTSISPDNKKTIPELQDDSGIDVISLGAYSEFDQEGVEAFGKIVIKSLANRQAMCLEHMAFTPRSATNRWIAKAPIDSLQSPNDMRTSVSSARTYLDQKMFGEMKFQDDLSSLLSQKQYEIAIELLKDLLNLLKLRYPDCNNLIMEPIMLNIGSIHLLSGDFEAALKSFQAARRGYVRFGRKNVDCLIVSLHKEALSLFAMGELVLAMEKFRNAIDLCEVVTNMSSNSKFQQKLAKIFNNVGCTMFKMGKYSTQKCAQMFTRASATMMESEQAPSMLDHSIFFSNYALSSIVGGYNERALAPMRASVEMQSSLLGEEHPITLSSMEYLTELYMILGRPSFSLYTKMIDIFVKKFGADDVKTGLIFGKVALAYLSCKKYSQALILMHKQLECQQTHLPDTHPDVLNTAYAIKRIEKLSIDYQLKMEIEDPYDSASTFKQLAEVL